MMEAYIGLGSNLGEPRGQIERALDALRKLPLTALLRCSPLYRNPALDPGQPDYVNGVAALETALPPLALLQRLQAIEREQGRERQVRWGPRTLDLDILLYGDEVMEHPLLVLPHPRIAERDFVLYPLADIAPERVIPGKGRVRALKAACPDRGLVRL